MFNSTVIATNMSATTQELADGRYIREAWATFARNPASGLSKQLHWPTFGSNETNVVNLATNSSVMSVGSAAALDSPCSSDSRK
jgi:hypothetical protein